MECGRGMPSVEHALQHPFSVPANRALDLVAKSAENYAPRVPVVDLNTQHIGRLEKRHRETNQRLVGISNRIDRLLCESR
jgi:hypothetical protein